MYNGKKGLYNTGNHRGTLTGTHRHREAKEVEVEVEVVEVEAEEMMEMMETTKQRTGRKLQEKWTLP